jgi:hypothetical protein
MCRPSNIQVLVMIKYGGYWRRIPRTNRKKYEVGKQKTMKLDVHSTRLEDLHEIHLEIALWIVELLTRVTELQCLGLALKVLKM